MYSGLSDYHCLSNLGLGCHQSRERYSGNFPFKVRSALKSRAYSWNTTVFPEQTCSVTFPTLHYKPWVVTAQWGRGEEEGERERERGCTEEGQAFRDRILVLWSLSPHSSQGALQSRDHRLLTLSNPETTHVCSEQGTNSTNILFRAYHIPGSVVRESIPQWEDQHTEII